ncbi:MAG: 2,3,4,5-tetrahydropyridine-2,6-dicarboxylate N-acetyltransferase [Candidatus Cloacimonadota bacterium]|nr:MAG: 2,3,4,5-tetrahydropyridine-2,6-dicarboxylate N-acetyltransferase [Candidatus Cloacimonadota bacterium]PIE77894.1 MAG: 2,3,4,5-tetrahydropyridine-2,6-dicarboxylate N-acetyltransferase [Candidatus Delongbacteria bacterium]
MKTEDLIKFISDSEKKTPVEVMISGNLSDLKFDELRYFGNDSFGTIVGEYDKFLLFLEKNREKIDDFYIKNDRRNSAIPILDYKSINARIEPGAIIRETAVIGDNCVIMMGAVINLGVVIGKKTMIDMNVVLGGRVSIGENCHIGAGSVLAGVIEPPSAEPVRVGNGVVMGANVTVLEGVKIGDNAVIAAGSVVIDDVESNMVVAGIPAKVIKKRDSKTDSKTTVIDSLRKL